VNVSEGCGGEIAINLIYKQVVLTVDLLVEITAACAVTKTGVNKQPVKAVSPRLEIAPAMKRLPGNDFPHCDCLRRRNRQSNDDGSAGEPKPNWSALLTNTPKTTEHYPLGAEHRTGSR
jgi:hypothetical protein